MAKNDNAERIASKVLAGGEILELLYDPERQATALAVCRNGEVSIVERYTDESGQQYVPYSAEYNLIWNQVIRFPSHPEAYGGIPTLLSEIQAFIHRYVALSKDQETIAAYYVLLSWVHDAFNELPYLGFRGAFGSGKSRAITTLGSLCYKPIFASGASTTAPLFHILDAFGGTLIFDEADFRLSDEKADIIKLLNNGNAKGFPLLRCIVNKNHEFIPKGYNVFGPKLVATRKAYTDKALESRFITHQMAADQLQHRPDIPISLPSVFHEEALALRNKLLQFRFDFLGRVEPYTFPEQSGLSPRVQQVFGALLGIVDDEETRQHLLSQARKANEQVAEHRQEDIRLQLLSVLHTLVGRDGLPLAVKAITAAYSAQYGASYTMPITPKWVGGQLRKLLELTLHKHNGVYVVSEGNREHLQSLFANHGFPVDGGTPEATS